MKNRYLQSFIQKDLKKKMVFLAGPRQVGKTTLAKTILKEISHSLYYNWDRRKDRKELLSTEWDSSLKLVVIDELHKYRFWKRWIKGEFDHFREQFRFLITGSARMDIYRKGGDSLQGRYHHYRLHPFTIPELLGHRFNAEIMTDLSFKESKESQDVLKNLLHFGGFPEPFLEQSEHELRRWNDEYVDRLIREDIRELEIIRDLSSMELLIDLIITKASQRLSLNSLREDIEVSHKAISHWVNILEKFYFIFRVYPFLTNISGSLKKEPKVYLWNYSMISEEAQKAENIVACHLLKFCHFLKDAYGFKANLFYVRDVEKREVDFLVTIDQKPWFAVEVKTSEETPSNFLYYFSKRLNIPYVYHVVLHGKRDYHKDKIRIIPMHKFLTAFI